jgi:hypothetical protein
MKRIAAGQVPDFNMTFFWSLSTRTYSTYCMDWRSGSLCAKILTVLAAVMLSSLPLIGFRTAYMIFSADAGN